MTDHSEQTIEARNAELLDAALAYADAGLHIFPCAIDGKNPAHGFMWKDESTNDRSLIRAMWEGEYKGHNIGVDCGRSMIDVVDYDPYENGMTDPKDGPIRYSPPLEAVHEGNWGQFVETAEINLDHPMIVETGSGGLHLYFQAEEGFRLGTTTAGLKEHFPQGLKVDLRGNGGYVVAPPSAIKHKKTGEIVRHRWAHDFDLDESWQAPSNTLLSLGAPKEKDTAYRQGEWADGEDNSKYDYVRWWNRTHPWGETLREAGFHDDGIDSEGDEYWRRPGKPEPRSGHAIIVHHDSRAHPAGTAVNFSSAAEVERLGDKVGLTPYEFFVRWDHDGDREAAKVEALAAWKEAKDSTTQIGQMLAPGVYAEGEEAEEEVIDHHPSLGVNRGKNVTWGGWKQRPPKQFIVEGNLVATNETGMVFGQSNAGKSFFAFELAMSVATGTPFLGKEILLPGPVLYIAAEGEDTFVSRGLSWERHHGIDMQDDQLHGKLGAVDITDREYVEDELLPDLLDHKHNFGGYQLVVIDTMAAAMVGNTNAAEYVNPFIHSVHAINRAIPGSVVVVHHSGHAEKERPKGPTELTATLDFIFRVDSGGGEGLGSGMTSTMVSTKARGRSYPKPISGKLLKRPADLPRETWEVPGDEYLPVLESTEALMDRIVAKAHGGDKAAVPAPVELTDRAKTAGTLLMRAGRFHAKAESKIVWYELIDDQWDMRDKDNPLDAKMPKPGKDPKREAMESFIEHGFMLPEKSPTGGNDRYRPGPKMQASK